MKKIYCFSLVFFVYFLTIAQEKPKLMRNSNGVVQLMIEEKPYVILGGELMNSSASTLESMKPKWEKLKKLNLNTVLLPVAWEQLEPNENEFDFSIVKGHIEQARKHNLKLVFLWFGSWKNASSGYAPHWVLSDTKRFPRMRSANGENRPYLSNFSRELMVADAKAFKALMSYIHKIDRRQQTVIMCQIENEVGLKGDSRDRSSMANQLFNSEVPKALLHYLETKEKQILPEIITRWNENGKKTQGSWPVIFGKNDLADEIFMAWHYAKFLENIAAEGKKVYALPMFVNAWTIDPEKPVPGIYPSGGPNSRMLDIWQAAAPSIDFIGVDNYRKNYKATLNDYYRNGNPIFVPEAVALWLGDKWSAPAKAFYTLSEFNALGFCPFAIDHPVYSEDHPVKKAYEVLGNLMPLMIKEQGTGNMRGFMQQDSLKERIDFKDFYVDISYDYSYQGYGLIIQLSNEEFLIAGNGANLSFHSKMKPLSGVSYGTIQEGNFVKNKWKASKYIGGDEARQGVGGIKLPPVYLKEDANPNTITTLKVRLVPIAGGTFENVDELN